MILNFECNPEREDQRQKRDVVLPFEPHTLAFDDVKYSVDMPQVTLVSVENL